MADKTLNLVGDAHLLSGKERARLIIKDAHEKAFGDKKGFLTESERQALLRAERRAGVVRGRRSPASVRPRPPRRDCADDAGGWWGRGVSADFVRALRDAANPAHWHEQRVPLPGCGELFVRVRIRERTGTVRIGNNFSIELAHVVVPKGDDIARATVSACKQARQRIEEWAEALREAEARLDVSDDGK